eukprot:6200001-Pleurochrysis_carterae.AAC.4
MPVDPEVRALVAFVAFRAICQILSLKSPLLLFSSLPTERSTCATSGRKYAVRSALACAAVRSHS